MEFNEEALSKLGCTMKAKFDTAAADRVVLEQQWLKNLRQYRGKYDPEVEDLIPKERSKVYPRDTYVKIVTFVAKMMEMMFPATESNYSINATPYPDISQENLQSIIDGLRNEKKQAMMSQVQQNPEMAQQMQDPAVFEPEAKDIELAVKTFADERADNMMKECQDQLAEIDHPDLSKRVLSSGAKYGFGITKGPLVKYEKTREWVRGADGVFTAVENEEPRPYYEHVKVWDIFPDLAAKHWHDQEGIFERIVFARHQLAALADREDMISKNIKKYLRDNTAGNYKSRAFETQLNVLNLTANLNKRDARKYEVIRYFGYLSGHELKAIGVKIGDNKLHQDILSDIWLLENTPIKAELAAFGEKPSDMYHAFIHMDDEDSGLTGIGLPEILRDTQMSRCGVRRMIMDNGAAVAGPIWEVNEDLLSRGKEVPTIHSFATIYREGTGPDAQVQAIRQLNTESHLSELLAVEAELKKDIDVESNLPSWTVGNAQPLGEAFRTSQNMSQMTGGANIITKDNVRSFDNYTKSLIGSLVNWNMEFNSREEIKGDYEVQPRGTISLVAKEVRGAALDQLASTMTPEDRQYVDGRELLISRFKSRDLDPNIVKTKEVCAQIDSSNAQAAAAKSQLEDGMTTAKTQDLSAKAQKTTVEAQATQSQNQAKIAELLSKVEGNLASAKSMKEKSTLETMKTLLETLKGEETSGQPTQNRSRSKTTKPTNK